MMLSSSRNIYLLSRAVRNTVYKLRRIQIAMVRKVGGKGKVASEDVSGSGCIDPRFPDLGTSWR
jgi:hypothetical protein